MYDTDVMDFPGRFPKPPRNPHKRLGTLAALQKSIMTACIKCRLNPATSPIDAELPYDFRQCDECALDQQCEDLLDEQARTGYFGEPIRCDELPALYQDNDDTTPEACAAEVV